MISFLKKIIYNEICLMNSDSLNKINIENIYKNIDKCEIFWEYLQNVKLKRYN